MIDTPRRHLWAVLVGVVVVLLVVPFVLVATAGAGAPPQATATRGPIQTLCQGPDDPKAPGRIPVLGVMAAIHDGPDAAYLLVGEATQGLTWVILCRSFDRDTNAGSSGGMIGPADNSPLSLAYGEGSSDRPDRLYAGMVAPSVTRVVATQASGATVEATVNGVWYLIWTRTVDKLVRITANDAAGAVVHTLENANGLVPPG